MNQDQYLKSVEKGIQWIESQMLTFNNGAKGIYERIRIDENIRTNWVRPDCNAEFARVLALYQQQTGSDEYQRLYDNIINWLIDAQENDELSAWHGTYPFYLVDGYSGDDKNWDRIYQNDNGKILIALLEIYQINGDKRLLSCAKKLADYWVGIQVDDGHFIRKDGRTHIVSKGTCFVTWLAVGLMKLYKLTKQERYQMAASKAFDYVQSFQLDNGRMQTTYEIEQNEDWRPVSSEQAIALYGFSSAYLETGDKKYLQPLQKAGEYLLALQDESGGIRNCNDDCLDASLQNNPNLCDMVYTEGFALMALDQAWKATEDKQYYDARSKLAEFLIQVQCHGESPLWDGAWRGTFNVKDWKWDGRANQNNEIDEGGMYSVYTGWSTTTIMYGLLLGACHHPNFVE